MSDVIIFIIGAGVTAVVGSAVGLLVWGASQERYVSGRHVGRDLLRSAEDQLRVTDETHSPGKVLPGGKSRSRAAPASNRAAATGS